MACGGRGRSCEHLVRQPLLCTGLQARHTFHVRRFPDGPRATYWDAANPDGSSHLLFRLFEGCTCTELSLTAYSSRACKRCWHSHQACRRQWPRHTLLMAPLPRLQNIAMAYLVLSSHETKPSPANATSLAWTTHTGVELTGSLLHCGEIVSSEARSWQHPTDLNGDVALPPWPSIIRPHT